MSDEINMMTVVEMPADAKVMVGHPHILVLSSGRVLVAYDQTGPGVKDLPGKKGHDSRRNHWVQSKVWSSDDHGATWKTVATVPFQRARLFRDGGDVFLLGDAGGLFVVRSPDGGMSWSAPMEVAADVGAVGGVGNVLAADGAWFVPMMREMPSLMKGQKVQAGVSIVTAPMGASLMNRKAWTLGAVSSPLSERLPPDVLSGVGVPLSAVRRDGGAWSPMERDPVVVPVHDESHPWRKEDGLVVLSSFGCQRWNWALVSTLSRGTLHMDWMTTLDNRPWAAAPLPGGHARFDVVWDSSSSRYWLVGNLSPDNPDVKKSPSTAGLKRLGLWYSANLLDWFFAGPIGPAGSGEFDVRMEPAVAIAGNDLWVACRAGHSEGHSLRDTPRILCCAVKGFRSRVEV